MASTLTRAQSRKHRGYKTQRLLAARWRAKGIAPYAKAAGAGEQGEDVLDVPKFSVEVKARDTVSLPAALRQADYKNGKVPVVVCRHNGQGEASINEWTVTMRLIDWEDLAFAD